MKKTIPKLTKEENTTSDGDKQSAANQEQNNKKVTVKATTLKKVVNKKTKKIEVTWKKVKGASGYTVYKKVVKNGTKAKKAKKIKFVKVKNISAKKCKFTLKLKKKATTSFYVKAFVKTKVNGKTKVIYGKASNVRKVKA